MHAGDSHWLYDSSLMLWSKNQQNTIKRELSSTNALGWMIIVVSLFICGAAFGQQKTYIYKPDGTIAGWLDQLPGGSSKIAIYDNQGKRVGTIEPGSNGNGLAVQETIPNSIQNQSIIQPTIPGFPGDGYDPFWVPNETE